MKSLNKYNLIYYITIFRWNPYYLHLAIVLSIIIYFIIILIINNIDIDRYLYNYYNLQEFNNIYPCTNLFIEPFYFHDNSLYMHSYDENINTVNSVNKLQDPDTIFATYNRQNYISVWEKLFGKGLRHVCRFNYNQGNFIGMKIICINNINDLNINNNIIYNMNKEKLNILYCTYIDTHSFIYPEIKNPNDILNAFVPNTSITIRGERVLNKGLILYNDLLPISSLERNQTIISKEIVPKFNSITYCSQTENNYTGIYSKTTPFISRDAFTQTNFNIISDNATSTTITTKDKSIQTMALSPLLHSEDNINNSILKWQENISPILFNIPDGHSITKDISWDELLTTYESISNSIIDLLNSRADNAKSLIRDSTGSLIENAYSDDENPVETSYSKDEKGKFPIYSSENSMLSINSSFNSSNLTVDDLPNVFNDLDLYTRLTWEKGSQSSFDLETGSHFSSDSSDSDKTVVPWKSDLSLKTNTSEYNIPTIEITKPDGTKDTFYTNKIGHILDVNRPDSPILSANQSLSIINYDNLYPNRSVRTYNSNILIYEEDKYFDKTGLYLKKPDRDVIPYSVEREKDYNNKSEKLWNDYFRECNNENFTIIPRYKNCVDFIARLDSIGIVQEFISPLSLEEIEVFKPIIIRELHSTYWLNNINLKDSNEVGWIILRSAYDELVIFNYYDSYIEFLENKVY